MKKTSILWPGLLWMIMMLLSPGIINAQESLWSQLEEADQKTLEGLVLYPDSTRMDILTLATQPGLLVRLGRLQAETRASLQSLLSSLPREDQESLWDLSRYPGLIDQLSTISSSDRSQLEDLLEELPSVIHERVRYVHARYPSLLVEMAHLDEAAHLNIERLRKDFSPDVYRALDRLLAEPEILDLLIREIELTILVGDAYSKDPDRVLAEADSLHDVIAEKHARELLDWKQELANNPEALDDLKEISEDMQSESVGYDDVYYDPETWRATTPEDGTVALPTYYYYHYPFWFSYPHWYAYPRWRPYPFWWEWGFYWQFSRPAIILQMPSFHVLHWYFSEPVYLDRHHHFTNLVIDHYYGHREHGSVITPVIDDWKYRNRTLVQDRWLADPKIRGENIRKMVQFENARQRYNARHPEDHLSQGDFLKQQPRKYQPATPSGRMSPRTHKPGISVQDGNIIEEMIRKRLRQPSDKVKSARDYHRGQWNATRTKPAEKSVTPTRTSPRKGTSTPVKKQPRKKEMH